jgi:hypothetical protein
MSTTTHNIGGASISVEIRPISKTTPPNPRVAPNIASFLTMMEKASFCGRDADFSKCLVSFLEEIDQYLDDGRMPRDLPMDDYTVGEMEEFMDDHLPASLRKQLKKLGEE